MGTPEGHQKSIFYTPKVKKKQIHPTMFASSTQKHKKVIETPNQPIEIKKISNKSMFIVYYFKSEKKAKIRMGANRRSLQAQPKILKKMIGTPNLPIRTITFPKKSMISTLKVEKSQKFIWGYPTEFAGSTQNP
jgi:uncharacterized protein YcgL (UPF0745 family)